MQHSWSIHDFRTRTLRKRAFMYCFYGSVTQHILAYCDADVRHASAPSLQWFPIQTAGLEIHLLLSKVSIGCKHVWAPSHPFGLQFFLASTSARTLHLHALPSFEPNTKSSTCLGTPCSLGTTGPVQLDGLLGLSPLTSLSSLTMKQSDMVPAHCP